MIDHLLGDRYRIQRKLGEGGMAIVYLAIDEKLGRNVAIKVLREKFQNHTEIRTRFQHEARAISAFDHSNILKVFDYSGPNSTQLWIVTELIHGRNLGQIVETAPGGWLHPVIASCIVRETSKALALAHSQGVIHRDVKPENVMITQSGVVKLMDFGIAKIQTNNSMTQTGMFMGSPSYMSSEQVRGRDVDHRSDIYSLGVLFYELVTGKLPFAGQSTADVAMKILNGQFQHPKFIKEHVPNEINDLILSMMALDPANRPQSTDSVAGVIDRFLELQGYESSSAELERCFRDPKQYGERLAKLSKQTMVVALPTQLLKSNQRVLEATKLPDHTDAVTKMVRSYNEKAIDTPQPYIPTKSFNELSRKNSTSSKIDIPPPPMRRDHKLPKRSAPQLSKKTAAAVNAIVHNLPERRLDPRNTNHEYSEIRKAEGFASPKNLGSNQSGNVQHRTAQFVVEINSESTKQNQKDRSFKPPRSIPRTPYKAAPKPGVRYQYVVHRDASVQSGFFSKFLIAILLVSIFAVVFSSQENLDELKEHFSSNKKYIASILKGTHNQKTPSQDLGRPHSGTVSKANQNTDAQNDKIKRPSSIQNQTDSSSTASNTSVKFDYNLDKIKKPVQTLKTAKQIKKPEKIAAKENPAKDKASVLKTEKTPAEPKAAPKVEVATPVESVAPPVASEKKPAAKSERVLSGSSEVQISSSPAAKIFINGKLSGTTNDKGTSSEWIKTKSGSIKIELKRDGFLTKTETITLKPQDKKALGPYTLERDNGTQKASSNYRLTLSSNTVPVEVIVVHSETKVTTSFTLRSATQNLSLAKGVYDVTIDNNGEVLRRRVDLSNAQPQMTFNAVFKNNVKPSDKDSENKDDGGTPP